MKTLHLASSQKSTVQWQKSCTLFSENIFSVCVLWTVPSGCVLSLKSSVSLVSVRRDPLPQLLSLRFCCWWQLAVWVPKPGNHKSRRMALKTSSFQKMEPSSGEMRGYNKKKMSAMSGGPFLAFRYYYIG